MIRQKSENKKTKHRVFIVDDHPIVREGLTELINRQKDLTVCGNAGNIPHALQAIADCRPDIALVDLTLEGGSGIRLVENLMYSDAGLSILVLSMHDESLYAKRCLKAGARGYIMKQEPPEKLLLAIRTVLKGEVYVSEELRKKLLSKIFTDKSDNYNSPVEILSTREMEVYQLLGRGFKKREIAANLILSVKTVENYIEHIKKKMHFKDAHELLMHAVTFIKDTK